MPSERDLEQMHLCLGGGGRQLAAGSGQPARDGSERTGGQRSEGRRQRTEDRGQMTEDCKSNGQFVEWSNGYGLS